MLKKSTKGENEMQSGGVTQVLPKENLSNGSEEAALANVDAIIAKMRTELENILTTEKPSPELEKLLASLKSMSASDPDLASAPQMSPLELVDPPEPRKSRTSKTSRVAQSLRSLIAALPFAPQANSDEENTAELMDLSPEAEKRLRSMLPLAAIPDQPANQDGVKVAIGEHQITVLESKDGIMVRSDQEQVAAEIQLSPDKKAKVIKVLGLLCLLLAAGVEAADVTTSLITGKKSYAITFFAAAIAFLAQFGLTGKPVQDAVVELMDIIKFKSIPTKKNRNAANENEDWPDLDNSGELKAIIIGTVAGLWGTYSKGSLAYYLMNTIPGDYSFADAGWWKTIACVFSVGYVATGLLTESLEFYKFTRQRLAGKSSPSPKMYARVIALMIGGTCAIVNALSDTASSIQGITTTWAIENATLGYWLTAVPSLVLDGGQKLVFEGRQLINGVEQSVNYVDDMIRGRNNAKFTLTLASIVVVMLALPYFLEVCKQPINKSFYEDVLSDIFKTLLSLQLISMLAKVLSYIGITSGAFIGAVSLHPEIKPIAEVAANKLDSIKTRLVDSCTKAQDPDVEATASLLKPDSSINDDSEDAISSPKGQRWYTFFANARQPNNELESPAPALPSWCTIS